MDRKSVFGFILIFIIIMAMPYYFKSVSKKPVDTQTPHTAVEPPIAQTQIISAPPIEKPAPKTDNKTSPVKLRADTLTIETDLYRLKVSSQGGGTLTSIVLKNYKKISGHDTSLVELIPPSYSKRLYLRFVNISGDSTTLDQNFTVLPDKRAISNGHYKIASNDSLSIKFLLNVGDRTLVSRTMVFYGNRFTIQLLDDLSGVRNEMASDKYDLIWEGGLAYTEELVKDDIYYSKATAYGGGETENLDVKSGKSGQSKLIGSTQWTAIRTKYFAAALIPLKPADAYCLTATGTPTAGKDFIKTFNMYLTLNTTEPNYTKIFIGPLDYSLIKNMAPGFENLMNFGFSLIRPISKAILWVFTEMHRIIPNYGWVLIIFSFLLKFALTPLTNSSTRSMKEMQKLQPQLSALHEKYGSDPQRENTEKMKMFKEHNINPMGGCLPILLQMPILWALFIVFRTTIELRQAPFIFWITDLSAPDTIFTLPFTIPLYGNHVNVLPILMAISQLIQQKFSGASGNQQQKVMMYFMTFFFLFLFNQFPSGLNLYYTLFNVLSIVQTKYFPPKPKPPKKSKKSALQNLRQYQLKMRRH